MNRKSLWVNKKRRAEIALKKRWAIINPAWQEYFDVIDKDQDIGDAREKYTRIRHKADTEYYKELEYIKQDKKIREVE